MSRLILNLRHVPDEEADEVRELLSANGIDYYETPPNRWGITAGGIWLGDESQADRVEELMVEYQTRRAREMRAEHDRRRREGTAETLIDLITRRPLQFIGAAAVVGLILYFSIMPFLWLGG